MIIVYLGNRVVDFYNITENEIINKEPPVRMEGIGLSTFYLTSYCNIIEVIVNSDDQIFVTERAKDIDGRNLESISLYLLVSSKIRPM